jgi:hypothetical protein
LLVVSEKTELFLELFGNSLVRKQTAEYVEKMASEFIKLVLNEQPASLIIHVEVMVKTERMNHTTVYFFYHGF